MRLNNKKGMSIPIVILVVATLAMIILALLAFSISSNVLKGEIGSYQNLRILYDKSDEVKFSETYNLKPTFFGIEKGYYKTYQKVEVIGNNLILKEFKKGSSSNELIYEFKTKSP